MRIMEMIWLFISLSLLVCSMKCEVFPLLLHFNFLASSFWRHFFSNPRGFFFLWSSVDGQSMGKFLLRGGDSTFIQRPVHTQAQFTFVRVCITHLFQFFLFSIAFVLFNLVCTYTLICTRTFAWTCAWHMRARTRTRTHTHAYACAHAHARADAH